jgi:hypothetical protein
MEQAVEGNLGGFACNSALVFGRFFTSSNSVMNAFQIDVSATVRGYVVGLEGTRWPLACFVQTDNHRGIVRSGPRPTPSSIVFKLGGVARRDQH